MNIIQDICEWNEVRENYSFNKALEYNMLDEELQEFIKAVERVDDADALADLIFVAVGSLWKLAGCDTQKVEDILLAVTAANNLKSATKNEDGKITKPKDFVGPEKMIERILCR